MEQKLIYEDSITINTTATVVSKAKYGQQESKRIAMILRNDSVNGESINIGVQNEARRNIGLKLAQGETISWSQDAGYKVPQNQITAIADVGTAKMSIYEEIEDIRGQ